MLGLTISNQTYALKFAEEIEGEFHSLLTEVEQNKTKTPNKREGM